MEDEFAEVEIRSRQLAENPYLELRTGSERSEGEQRLAGHPGLRAP